MLTISGAYGRDYKSKKAILDDWDAGKDFIIRNWGADDGRYINSDDAFLGDVDHIEVRYSADRKVCVIQQAGRHHWK